MKDPHELNNLAGKSEYKDIEASLTNCIIRPAPALWAIPDDVVIRVLDLASFAMQAI